MQQKNILYLSYDGMTDPLGQSQVLPYLVGLSAMGYRFWLISFEKADKFEALCQQISDICKRHHICWLPQIYHKSPPVLSTLYDLWVMYRQAAAIIKKHHIEATHCRSYLSALVGRRLWQRHNIPFLFDMRGFWADERVEGGIWNQNKGLYRQIYRFFKHQERNFLLDAQHIVVLTQKAVEIIHQWEIQRPNMPISVIPCCADTVLFSPEKYNTQEIQDIRTQLGIKPDDLLICYIGSLGTWYMLPEMLDFFAILQQHLPNAHLLLLNNQVHEQQTAQQAIKQRALQQVHILGAKYTKVPLYIAASDWGLFFIRPTFSKQASSPVKLGEIWAMDTPIICNAGVGDTDAMLQKYEIGCLVEDFNETAYTKIAQQLQTAYRPPANLMRTIALQYFSLEKGVQSYNKIYQQLLGVPI